MVTYTLVVFLLTAHLATVDHVDLAQGDRSVDSLGVHMNPVGSLSTNRQVKLGRRAVTVWHEPVPWTLLEEPG